MVGIDILEIERMERALTRRPNLARRLFTQNELGYAQGRPRPAQHLAARFCAKEAAFKALALDVFRPLEIEVLSGGPAPPRLQLHGATRDAAQGRRLELSLTHSRGIAAAVAVAL